MGFHGVIEFTNRMLARAVRGGGLGDHRRALREALAARTSSRLGWTQFWIVMSNAILRIVVLVGLNPYTVAAHFPCSPRRSSRWPR